MQKFWLLLILGLSFSTLLITQFILVDVNEFITGAAKVGDILYQLSLAYIASFVFYIIVVYLPERNNKNNIKEYCSIQTKRIIGDADSLVEALINSSGLEIDKNTISEQKIIEICKNIDPFSQAPLILGLGNTNRYATWSEFIYLNIERTKTHIDKSLANMVFLDSEYVKILNKILSSSFFAHHDTFNPARMRMTNTDISFISKSIFEFWSITRDLEKYSKNKKII